jgi:hypothetical protein
MKEDDRTAGGLPVLGISEDTPVTQLDAISRYLTKHSIVPSERTACSHSFAESEDHRAKPARPRGRSPKCSFALDPPGPVMRNSMRLKRMLCLTPTMRETKGKATGTTLPSTSQEVANSATRRTATREPVGTSRDPAPDVPICAPNPSERCGVRDARYGAGG